MNVDQPALPRSMFGVVVLACVFLISPGLCFTQEKPIGADAPSAPIAIFPFHDRGGKANDASGEMVTELLFAELAKKSEMYLVERQDLSKTLSEFEINLSGAVNPNQAVQIGQLTGAKILITGSIVQVDSNKYLIAKIIGTETSRVLGASVKGASDADVGTLVEKLAAEIASTIAGKSDQLIAKVPAVEDRIEALKKKLGDKARPVLTISVNERHVSRPATDPAAQTELELFAKESGFSLMAVVPNTKPTADILITGEGVSETGARVGKLVSVKARLEVKATDRRTGRVIAVDRQTTIVLENSEQIAGKLALQAAAAKIAERLLPKLVTTEEK